MVRTAGFQLVNPGSNPGWNILLYIYIIKYTYYLPSHNTIEIIYLQITYTFKKPFKNLLKKPFKKKFKINTFLAYFFRIFFTKPRPRVRNLYKYKLPNLLIFVWALNVAKERGLLFKSKFIEFLFNFYKQLIDYVY